VKSWKPSPIRKAIDEWMEVHNERVDVYWKHKKLAEKETELLKKVRSLLFKKKRSKTK
jgi:hypothetical protein